MTQSPPLALQTASDSSGWCEPQNLVEAMTLAKMIANSAIVPNALRGKPGDVLVAMQLGAEVGLSPMAALQNVAVINGRPCLWGDAMLAVCKGHPDWVDIVETITSDGQLAQCTVRRRGQTATTSTFTMEDARTANLATKKGPWQEYPKRMLQLRARGFALRDAFPDALRGIISAEEARDIPAELPLDEHGVPVHEIQPKTRAAKTAARVKAKQDAKPPSSTGKPRPAKPGPTVDELADDYERSKAEPEKRSPKASPAKFHADRKLEAKDAKGGEIVDDDPFSVDEEPTPVEQSETRDQVLADVVKICTENGTEQKDMLQVVRSIIERNVTSAAALTLWECLKIRRVLREEQYQETPDE